MFPALLIQALIFSAAAAQNMQEVNENSPVTIQCPLMGNVVFPTWTGPAGLANPLTQGQTINEPGMEWENDRDLKITSTMLKHDGMYTCKDGMVTTATVELDVQYFSASATITTARPDDTQVTFTCTAYSNPVSTIRPSTFTRGTPPGRPNPTTTFHECQPDPTNENRQKCGVTDIGYVAKEDNGKEVSCEFMYKNSSKATIFRNIQFLFPPMMVTITGNKPINASEESTLKLTCSADSSNPVSTLVWRKGTKAMASDNDVITSSYNPVVMDADYNGKNITQDIDINVSGDMNGEKVFCCASNQVGSRCYSVMLEYKEASSAPRVATSWLTLAAVCIALLISLLA